MKAGLNRVFALGFVVASGLLTMTVAAFQAPASDTKLAGWGQVLLEKVKSRDTPR